MKLIAEFMCGIYESVPGRPQLARLKNGIISIYSRVEEGRTHHFRFVLNIYPTTPDEQVEFLLAFVPVYESKNPENIDIAESQRIALCYLLRGY